MSGHNDIATLRRRIDHLTRAACRIRDQLADLHALAYEAAITDNERTRAPGFESRPPPGATTDFPDIGRNNPQRISRRDQAIALWARTETEAKRCEELLVGLERAVTGWFMITTILEPTRGSLISAAEHDRLRANQRARAQAGEYTPARMMAQPNHPGKGNR